MSLVTRRQLREWLHSDRTVELALLGTAIIFVQALIVSWYAHLYTVDLASIRYVVYPFVWINVGLLAVFAAERVVADRRIMMVAGIVAGGYLFVLLWLPGKIALGGNPDLPTGLDIRGAVPGWGPIVAYNGPSFRAYLVPFEVIGYSSLAYLVYLNIVHISRASLAGVFGIVTCIGCTVPVVVPLLGILGGTGTTLASTAYSWSYDIGTALFVLIVVVLYYSHWRAVDA